MKAILWIAVIAWMILALFLTLQNGTGTVTVSNGIANVLYRILTRCGVVVRYAEFHQALRSAAHFFVFLVFGLLFTAALLIGEKDVPVPRFPVTVIVVCTAISVVPEVMKLWIPGRHLQWDEVLLNILGVYTGIFGSYGIWHVLSR